MTNENDNTSFEDAAATMYPDQPGDQPGHVADGQVDPRDIDYGIDREEDEPMSEQERAEKLYSDETDQKSLAERYYSSLFNNNTVQEFTDNFANDPSVSYEEVHQELGRGLHHLGVNDESASLFMNHLVQQQYATPTAEEIRQNAAEMRDWLYNAGEKKALLNEVPGLMEDAFPQTGEAWGYVLLDTLTPALADRLCDMVIDYKRNRG